MKEVGYVDVEEQITKIPSTMSAQGTKEGVLNRVGLKLTAYSYKPFLSLSYLGLSKIEIVCEYYLFVGLSSSHSPFCFAPPSNPSSPKWKFLTIDVGRDSYRSAQSFSVPWSIDRCVSKPRRSINGLIDQSSIDQRA
jgi:hypothetical protein